MDSPRVRVRPRGAVLGSDGPDAVDLAAAYGLVADDWQELILEDWLLRGRRDVFLARTCGLAVPRQNGKNGALEIRELFGLVVLGEKILHTAHEVKTARKAFKRLKYFLGEGANDPGARFPELNALVFEVRNTNGQEAIVLHAVDCGTRDEAACDCQGGASVEFVARSKGSGRGFTVDVLVLDEAQDLTDEELEALLPTISSAPLRNPQIIVMGTPPDPEKGQTGEVFTRVRTDGVKGLDKALSWIDFGVADGPLESVPLDDDEVLEAVNPALRTGRLQLSVCRTERRRMSAAGYARERFGWWGNPKDDRAAGPFEPGSWEAAELEPGDRPLATAIGVAVSVDRAWSSLGAIGTWDDGSYLVGAVRHERGTAWIVDECARLQATYGCAIVVDGKGPASDLIDKLREAGVAVTIAGTEDYVIACSTLFDAVRDGEVTHMGDEDLEDAVAAASTRKVGDRWAWARRSAADISMLEAVTLAWFGRDLGYDIGDSVL